MMQQLNCEKLLVEGCIEVVLPEGFGGVYIEQNGSEYESCQRGTGRHDRGKQRILAKIKLRKQKGAVAKWMENHLWSNDPFFIPNFRQSA